jgi:hypothetical protein
MGRPFLNVKSWQIPEIFIYMNNINVIGYKMNNQQRCPKCRKPMKQIPIKRLDSAVIIELYCENCDESITLYPNIGEIKFESAKFF